MAGPTGPGHPRLRFSLYFVRMWQATQWSLPTSTSGGSSSLQIVADLRLTAAARVEPAAGGRVDRRRHVALQDDALALAASDRASGSPTAAPACRGAAGWRTARRVSASSTILPRYITADAVGDVLDHRQVVGDEQVGEAELVAAGPAAG